MCDKWDKKSAIRLCSRGTQNASRTIWRASHIAKDDSRRVSPSTALHTPLLTLCIPLSLSVAHNKRQLDNSVRWREWSSAESSPACDEPKL